MCRIMELLEILWKLIDLCLQEEKKTKQKKKKKEREREREKIRDPLKCQWQSCLLSLLSLADQLQNRTKISISHEL